MDAAGEYIVFVDESGDHGLRTINADYPVFVLACCIFEKRQYLELVCPAIQRFKLRWWPHDAVILHSSQIKPQQPPFAFLTHVETRERLMGDLADTLTAMPFSVVASSIHKCRLREANLAGLQIADLIGTPIGRHLLKPNETNRAFELVREKLWLPPLSRGEARVLELYP